MALIEGKDIFLLSNGLGIINQDSKTLLSTLCSISDADLIELQIKYQELNAFCKEHASAIRLWRLPQIKDYIGDQSEQDFELAGELIIDIKNIVDNYEEDLTIHTYDVDYAPVRKYLDDILDVTVEECINILIREKRYDLLEEVVPRVTIDSNKRFIREELQNQKCSLDHYQSLLKCFNTEPTTEHCEGAWWGSNVQILDWILKEYPEIFPRQFIFTYIKNQSRDSA